MGTQRTLDSDRRWKGRYIPWARDPRLNGMATTLRDGMALIEAKTHLRFIERTNERDHIYFKPGEGCSSEEVGREVRIFRADGGQLEITIDTWAKAGDVAHEICHALGMFHEQCRQDRTRYVSIDWDNIKPDKRHNYEKYDSATGKDIGPYDFESIMHYPAGGDFAKDPSKPIITVKNLAGLTGYTGDPAKMGLTSDLTDGDVAAINGLPRGILHINRINADGSIGMRTDTRDWSDGWTHAVIFSSNTAGELNLTGKTSYEPTKKTAVPPTSIVQPTGRTVIAPTKGSAPSLSKLSQGAGKPFLFILKKLTGIVHVHQLTDEVGACVDSRDWSSDWSSIDSISFGEKAHLLLLRVSDGNIHVHEMNTNGTVGAQTDSKDWASGYTTGKLFTVDAKGYLFLLKKGNGTVKIHSFGADGKIGSKVVEYDWSPGWSSVCFAQVGSETYLILLKEDDGEIHVHRMLPGGKVGPQTDKKNWTSGYTQLVTYQAGGVNYLLFLKRSDGVVKVHPIDATGKIGNVHREYNWRSGWGSVATYMTEGQSYLVLLRERY